MQIKILIMMLALSLNVFSQTKEEKYLLGELEEVLLSVEGRNQRLLDPTSNYNLDKDDILKRSQGWKKQRESNGNINYTIYTNSDQVSKRKFHLLGLANSKKYGEVKSQVTDILNPKNERIILNESTLALNKFEANSTFTGHDKDINFTDPVEIRSFGAINMDTNGLKSVTKCGGLKLPEGKIEVTNRCKSKDCDKELQSFDVASAIEQNPDVKRALDNLKKMKLCATINHHSCEKIAQILKDKSIKKLFKGIEKRAECSKLINEGNEAINTLQDLTGKLAKNLNESHSEASKSIDKYRPDLKGKLVSDFDSFYPTDLNEAASGLRISALSLYGYKRVLDELNSACKEHGKDFRTRELRKEAYSQAPSAESTGTSTSRQ